MAWNRIEDYFLSAISKRSVYVCIKSSSRDLLHILLLFMHLASCLHCSNSDATFIDVSQGSDLAKCFQRYWQRSIIYIILISAMHFTQLELSFTLRVSRNRYIASIELNKREPKACIGRTWVRIQAKIKECTTFHRKSSHFHKLCLCKLKQKHKNSIIDRKVLTFRRSQNLCRFLLHNSTEWWTISSSLHQEYPKLPATMHLVSALFLRCWSARMRYADRRLHHRLLLRDIARMT